MMLRQPLIGACNEILVTMPGNRNKPLIFSNEMTLASAGSGKTYALTNRFIAMMAAGSPPERICALTFTRKAAGEFLDVIIRKLAAAASDAKEAAQLSSELNGVIAGLGERGVGDFVDLLERLVSSLHCLRLGTLDSFCHEAVRAFALDLGLTGEFVLLQGYEAEHTKRALLAETFAAGIEERRLVFHEAFKLATFGGEEKNVARLLEGFVRDAHELFLQVRDAARWGRLDVFAGGYEQDEATFLDAVTRLQAHVEHCDDRPKDFLKTYRNGLNALAGWRPGQALSGTLIKRLFETYAADGAVHCLKLGRSTVDLDAEEQQCLVTIILYIYASTMHLKAKRTRGVGEVMAHYEALYEVMVRQRGMLTFADLPRILNRATLSCNERTDTDTELRRLMLDYRLDGQIDHWLFDEFQDTSRAQWTVFANLVAEALQDEEGRRSFYYVGDVKQSLYGWRGGDNRLFEAIREQYPDRIVRTMMSTSWRSAPAVLDAVNGVFGSEQVLARHFGVAAAMRWDGHWETHRPSPREATKSGCTAFFSVEKGDLDRDMHKFACVLDLLMEIQPHRRGLSCGILVQKNTSAEEMVDYLRQHGEGELPVTGELDVKVSCDNPVSAAVKSLLKLTVHPGDTLALEHVCMTPLASLVEGQRWRGQLLETLHGGGFESVVGWLAGALEKVLDAGDAFSRLRLRQLSEAARQFDRNGERDIDQFLDFLTHYTVREGGAEQVIQVMTVHKSKGLGFDVVILPELEKLHGRRSGQSFLRGGQGEAIEWVLERPPKEVCQMDALLRTKIEESEDEEAYEEICTLYVAMTRAKRGLYLVALEEGRSQSSQDFRRLIGEALADCEGGSVPGPGEEQLQAAAVFGEPSWYLDFSELEETLLCDELETIAPKVDRRLARPAPLARRMPSQADDAVAAGVTFDVQAGGALALGSVVHSLLERVEWLTPESLPELEAYARGQNDVPTVLHKEALEMVRAFFSVPAVVDAFMERPGVTVWRERSFEALVEGDWVSGIFDRVELECDPLGLPVSARIVDYKTNRVTDGDVEAFFRERYTEQLALYRKVVAQLTRLDERSIQCYIYQVVSGLIISIS